MRLFVAITLSDEMKKTVTGTLHSLKKAGVKGSYVPSQNLHLTLAFIGEVKDSSAVKEALGLENVEVLQSRAEIAGQDGRYREQFDRAAARAVAPLNLLCEYLLPLVKVGGAAICWKGPGVREEMEDGEAAAMLLGGRIERIAEIGPDDTRHTLAVIRKWEKTVPQYPRKNGIPAKRPLKKTKT